MLLTACGQPQKSAQKTDNKPAGRKVIPETTLTFLGFDGRPVSSIEVELADEQLERSQGLMDVRSMPENEGMLFIFDEERVLSFWMANTPLSLDIMFVNSDSTIVRIHQNTTPFSNRSLASDAPAIFVVETNAGYALSHGLTEGMKIRF